MFKATFIDQTNEFQARLVHEQVDEITAYGNEQVQRVEATGLEQVQAVQTAGAVQRTSIEDIATHPDQPGDDGYWYIWDATTGVYVKSDKSCLGPKGDTGDTGPSGPAGFDAEVTAENITAALGYTPAAPDGDYELIETITLAEDTERIVRTQEPDGTVYAFRAFGIVVSSKTGVVNSGLNVIVSSGNDRLNSGFINSIISTGGERFGYCEVAIINGVWTAAGSGAVNGYTWTVTSLTGQSPAYAFKRLATVYPSASQILIQINISGAVIPAGTVIEIYGVRA